MSKSPAEIEQIAAIEPNCKLLMSVPGMGATIFTAMVAAIGDAEAFELGRDSELGSASCRANTAPAASRS